MKYARILAYVMSQPWAMEPRQMQAMIEALIIKASGGQLPFDIEADNGGVPYMARDAKVHPNTANKIARAPGSVAILPVRGVLSHRMGSLEESSGNTTYERLGHSLRQLMANEQVKAIVLDVNSPGGTTDGVLEAAADIRSLRSGAKPIVASVNVRAASAAYWLASQADDIAITPSGDVGSIGVWTMHQDISGWLEQMGVKNTLISAGQFKVEGNPYEPLSDEAREAIQADVDRWNEMFIADVAAGRNVDTADVEKDFGNGRMVSAEQAVKRGMADRVATLEETLNRYGASLYGESPQRRAREARRDLMRAQAH